MNVGIGTAAAQFKYLFQIFGIVSLQSTQLCIRWDYPFELISGFLIGSW